MGDISLLRYEGMRVPFQASWRERKRSRARLRCVRQTTHQGGGQVPARAASPQLHEDAAGFPWPASSRGALLSRLAGQRTAGAQRLFTRSPPARYPARCLRRPRLPRPGTHDRLIRLAERSGGGSGAPRRGRKVLAAEGADLAHPEWLGAARPRRPD